MAPQAVHHCRPVTVFYRINQRRVLLLLCNLDEDVIPRPEPRSAYGFHNPGVDLGDVLPDNHPMRVLVRRVCSARVLVGGQVVAAIEPDSQELLAFVGVTHDDDVAIAQRMAEKLWRLRVLDAERSAGLDPMWWTRDLWLESGRRFASVIATKFTAVSLFPTRCVHDRLS
jgi:D-Tyr-tRNA(Tyr) deacylase